MFRRFALIGSVAVAAAASIAPIAVGVTLPPAVLAPLRAQVTRSNTDLAVARRDVAKRAIAQQRASALRARTTDYAALATLVGRTVPGFADVAEPFERARRTANSGAAQAQRALDDVTQHASTLQGAAIDAQRRLDAIQRAASTSASTPTGEGASYRFGSAASAAVSAESLDRYLQSKASPIAGSGTALLAAGVKYHVDPRLIIAISGAESYFGLQLCAPYNAWGWGCPSGPVRFASFDDAVTTIARGLRERYVDDGLTTVGEIHLRYAPPNATNDPTGLNYAWADNVARFLIEQGGDPQHIEGPLAPIR